jgi:hypothetical protein
MDKLHRRYLVALDVHEIIEEPGGKSHTKFLYETQAEMRVSRLELWRLSGDYRVWHGAFQAVVHALKMAMIEALNDRIKPE